MLRLSALLLTLVLVTPVTMAAGPNLSSTVSTTDIQTLLNAILGIAEAKPSFKEGNVVEVKVGTERWSGIMSGGGIVMNAGAGTDSTHEIEVERPAMMSIVNAYDTSNTMKLAVKARYMTARSDEASVNTAIGALARTPLDDKLPTYTPKGGDSIMFRGCTGALSPQIGGLFNVTLCDDRYQVNEIGGVTTKLPPLHLTTPPAGINLSAFAGSSYGPNSAMVCPILVQLFNAFAASPFAAAVKPIILQLGASFGCTGAPFGGS